jgi:hypothetical protein
VCANIDPTATKLPGTSHENQKEEDFPSGEATVTDVEEVEVGNSIKERL